MPFPAADLNDAREALRAAGRDAATFRFEYVPYPRHGCGAGPPPADVVVTNTLTGVKCVYNAGAGSKWLTAFSDHVATGQYWP